ncbi:MULTISPECIES: MBL fold metallo-hydrolase [Alteribacter]|uniref:MBL fold metallo-hydrolase n=1 Tax=Alteribacter keqinensis TaxID=2483800 RepID=A0A3M7TVC0_9BACI|nr:MULTISPECIES: MBL fold metallo-hydrolase [Alteribacter]MBM7097325.1 MBL fold metallo-hydrolase [Alteribacter salitolerans]RNA68942.1 MBL fold metallo-hydrolase [Alteribacter keqinensis]
MKIMQMPLGPLQTNGYLIHNEDNRAIMIDPGGDGFKVLEVLKEKGLTLEAIVLTHAHFDHIGGINEIREEVNVPVFVHEKEKEWLTDPSKNGSGKFPGLDLISVNGEVETISGEETLKAGPFIFSMLETPGHSPGSVSFYMPRENVIFSGDVLFQGGVGRTDLPGGHTDTLLSSIHEKLLTLPDETIVANGHGPTTTIGEEKESNPFLNGF